jgi:phage terminase large subunit-like protein
LVRWCDRRTTRDSIQRHLLGRQGQIGTGALPQAHILHWTAARGVSGLADTVLVRHIGGGTSQIAFKTYARGREPWQGESCDVVALDEEPPLDIYLEALTRTNAMGGLAAMVFTPLLGMSEVVRRFYLGQHPDRASVRMTILDAEHFGEELRQRILASYGTADVEARARGIPQLGSGAVFPVAEEDITIKAFPIPPSTGRRSVGWILAGITPPQRCAWRTTGTATRSTWSRRTGSGRRRLISTARR